MVDTVIIDTDVLIDVGLGIVEAVECLQQIQENQYILGSISLVTQTELHLIHSLVFELKATCN